MGCVSSKILAKSGSFQEKVSCSLGHSFQRSSAIEEIILSTSKSNGDQFLALLRRSTSSARKAKEPEAAPAAVAEPVAKIETIDVSELLAGLEEESCTAAEEARERRQSSRDGPPAPWPASDGGAAGRARSFRTVEEFDAMVVMQQEQQTQSESGSSSERPTALATEQEEELATATAATASTAEAELSGGSGSKAAVGAKRRARARQLGELNVPTAAAFDFSISKSGSLRDWLRQGGQIFSPGSYVTPRFGTSPPAERGGAAAGEQQQALFDPELVAQFERAMEQLSEDEGRVLDEILEALELEAAEKNGAAAAVGRVRDGQPADVAAAALVQQV
jgi:tricin synthase